jgi:hypothetical protein
MTDEVFMKIPREVAHILCQMETAHTASSSIMTALLWYSSKRHFMGPTVLIAVVQRDEKDIGENLWRVILNNLSPLRRGLPKKHLPVIPLFRHQEARLHVESDLLLSRDHTSLV